MVSIKLAKGSKKAEMPTTELGLVHRLKQQTSSATKNKVYRDFRGVQLDGSVPATEFVIFSQLPTELRLRIWRAAAPAGHRLIRLNHFYGDLPAPPCHAVCQASSESREETLRRFDLPFHVALPAQTGYPRVIKTITETIMLDPEFDVGYLDLNKHKGHIWDSPRWLDPSGLKNLALDVGSGWQYNVMMTVEEGFYLRSLPCLSRCPNLTTITLLLIRSQFSEYARTMIHKNPKIYPALLVPLAEWPETLPSDFQDTGKLISMDYIDRLMHPSRNSHFGYSGIGPDTTVVEHALRFLRNFQKKIEQIAMDTPTWNLPVVEVARIEVARRERT